MNERGFTFVLTMLFVVLWSSGSIGAACGFNRDTFTDDGRGA